MDAIVVEVAGPGVITGAADDDPSGIATYCVAGAQLGTKILWTALLTWPLMAAVQMTCARIGKVTGQSLAGNFKQRFPSWLLGAFIVALLAANTINIAADLAGMADAAAMLSGVNVHLLVVVFTFLISWATVRLPYDQIATLAAGLSLFRPLPGSRHRPNHRCAQSQHANPLPEAFLIAKPQGRARNPLVSYRGPSLVPAAGWGPNAPSLGLSEQPAGFSGCQEPAKATRPGRAWPR
jgi:hypothetical protein